jgi:hypothetical protein
MTNAKESSNRGEGLSALVDTGVGVTGRELGWQLNEWGFEVTHPPRSGPASAA